MTGTFDKPETFKCKTISVRESILLVCQIYRVYVGHLSIKSSTYITGLFTSSSPMNITNRLASVGLLD